MLEVGVKAPEFALENQNGELVKLSDFEGKRLYFIFIRRIIHRDVRLRRAVTPGITRSSWIRLR